jgi:DNA-binding IclR family transcriptional regulator
MSVALEWLAHRATRATTLAELAETVNETAELMMMENHEWWVLLSFQGVRLHV